MAKTTKVTLTISVTGDGVNDSVTYARTNLAGPESWGPQPVVIPPGGSQGVNVPSGAVGLVFLPSPGLADVEVATQVLDPTQAHYIALPAGTVSVAFGSTAGGTAIIRWA